MLYIKKTMNPSPVEIDEYKNYMLIFSKYENKREKNITVKAVGTNQNFNNYICLQEMKDHSQRPVEMTFISINDARKAIQKKIDQNK